MKMTVVATTVKVVVVVDLIAVAVGVDEEWKRTMSTMRDRTLALPGRTSRGTVHLPPGKDRSHLPRGKHHHLRFVRVCGGGGGGGGSSSSSSISSSSSSRSGRRGGEIGAK